MKSIQGHFGNFSKFFQMQGLEISPGFRDRRTHWFCTAPDTNTGVMKMDPGDMVVRGGTDTDYATCKRTHVSREGIFVTIGNAVLLYRSSMQQTVATSPAEAEF